MPNGSVAKVPAKSFKFIPNGNKPLYLGDNIPPKHCWKRSTLIVEKLNKKFGFGFVVEDGIKGTELFGHAVMAYDPEAQVGLIIGEDHMWAMKPHVQDLVQEFENHGWHVLFYVASLRLAVPFVPNQGQRAEQDAS